MKAERVQVNIPLVSARALLSWDKPTLDHLVEQSHRHGGRGGAAGGPGRAGRIPQGGGSRRSPHRLGRAGGDVHAQAGRGHDRGHAADLPRAGPAAARDVREGPRRAFFVGNGANLLFDWDRWQVRAPDAADLVELCRWAAGCEHVGLLFPPVMLKDVDQRLSALYGYAVLARYYPGRIGHEQATEPIHVKYLDRMARIVEAHRGFYFPMLDYEYVNPPFRMSRRAIETMPARVDLGVCTTMDGPMPVAGMSAPVTVAGAAVTAVAEVLAGLTFFRLLRPGYGLRPNTCVGASTCARRE